MHCNRNRLFRAIRLGLAAGLIGASALAWAQESEPDADQNETEEQQREEGAQLDRVEVTGSRIRRLDVEGPNPVQIFDRDYIDSTGAQTVADFLFQAQFAGPGLFNENATLSQYQGSAFFDSRGLGAAYTLVLIDGKRLPITPLGGTQAADINQLPIAAVERIEYLSDGASAIYGSDAIAGVINVITKRDFQGLNLRGQAGTADDGDATRLSSEIVGGATGDRWRALVAFDWYKQSDIEASDRPLAESAIAPDGTDGRSPTGLPGTFITVDPETSDFLEAIPQEGCPESSLRPTEVAATGFDCSYNFARLYDIVPASRSYNLFSKFQYDFTSRLMATFQWRHSNTQIKVRNGAAPAFFFLGPEDNPTGQPAFFLRRFVDAGPRARDTTNTTNSFLAQLDYNMGMHDLQVYALGAEVENNQVGVSGQISERRIEEAVADGTFDPLQTYDPQFFIDEGLAVGTQRQATGDQTTVGTTLSGFLPFDLGGMPVGYAVGGSWLDESYFDISDGDAVDRDIAGGAGSFGGGDRQTTSFFGEINANPLEQFEVSLAARHDDIKDIGSETTYRASASYRPTDALLPRAVAGQSLPGAVLRRHPGGRHDLLQPGHQQPRFDPGGNRRGLPHARDPLAVRGQSRARSRDVDLLVGRPGRRAARSPRAQGRLLEHRGRGQGRIAERSGDSQQRGALSQPGQPRQRPAHGPGRLRAFQPAEPDGRGGQRCRCQRALQLRYRNRPLRYRSANALPARVPAPDQRAPAALRRRRDHQRTGMARQSAAALADGAMGQLGAGALRR
jgi:iron complex outermembrane receptor protein